MSEIWKPIPGYEGYYEASTYGRVRSVDRYTINRWGSKTFHGSQIMKCRKFKNGYMHVKLTKNGKGVEPSVHRLIAITFIPNPGNLSQVNHIDGNKSNNYITNLEWCSSSENQLHSRRVLNRICGLTRKKTLCIDTGEIFDSTHHAARAFNLSPGGVYNVCIGKNKHTGGMHFKFVD